MDEDLTAHLAALDAYGALLAGTHTSLLEDTLLCILVLLPGLREIPRKKLLERVILFREVSLVVAFPVQVVQGQDWM